MNKYQQIQTGLQTYKQIELNNKKNLQFFLEKHSTKEGTWGHLSVDEGTMDFVFLDGEGIELSHHKLNSKSQALAIAPASWYRITSTSTDFKATLRFCCQPHRYFEKKYRLAPIHNELYHFYQDNGWSIFEYKEKPGQPHKLVNKAYLASCLLRSIYRTLMDDIWQPIKGTSKFVESMRPL